LDYVIWNIKKWYFGIQKIYGVTQEGTKVHEEAAFVVSITSIKSSGSFL